MDESGLKVLVVDDTVTYRQILSDVVGAIPTLALAGAAPSGEVALKKLAQMEVDVVLLDVFMPDMDGVQTLERIRKEFPDVFTIMISGATTRHAEITIRALELGAIDFLPKPTVENYEQGVAELAEALKPIIRVIKVKRLAKKTKRPVAAPAGAPAARPASEPAPAAPPAVAPAPAVRAAPVPRQFQIVLIGVSTGGPNALQDVLSRLPADYPLPILIVQHMPPLFTDSLAKSLAKKCPLDVREAKEGDAVKAGAVLIAPGGRHMTVRTDSAVAGGFLVGINDSPPVNSCRPSVDVLFRSAASVCSGTVSVILTGMGDDGAAGVATLKRKGCFSIAQNEETCVVYGMPRSVIEKGLADEVLPLESIAGRLVDVARKCGTPGG